MILTPDTTDIIVFLSTTFSSILLLTLIICYYKKILNLLDYFSFDFFVNSSTNDERKTGSKNYGKNDKKGGLC